MDAPGPEGGPGGLMRQRSENITAFLHALEGLVPADCTFSPSDLDADDSDRPLVANCMLFLKTLMESGAAPRPVPLRSPRAAAAGQLPGGSHASPGHAALYQQHQQQLLQQQQAQAARYSPTQQQAQQLALLQARMTPRSSSSYSRPATDSYGRPATAPVVNPHELMQSPYANEPPFAGATAALQRFAATSNGNLFDRTSIVNGTFLNGNGSSIGSGTDSIKAAQNKSVQAAAGVTRLMQQCTAMLRERMFVDGPGAPPQQQQHRPAPVPRFAAPAPDSSALEAMGPVLENVLSSLTMEYEKRLLTKDHELNHAKEANSVLQKQVGRQLELVHVQLCTA